MENKYFCCTGCKTAYQVLEKSGLCNYYDLESNPGISLKSSVSRARFDYLEDEDVIEQISDYKSEKQLSVTLRIPNIHCTSCIWLLENLQKLDEGVLKTTVNFLKRELSLLIDTEKTTLRNVVEQLTTIGYEPEIRLDKLDTKSSKAHQNRSLWLKLGVAGFAFGNIMLFSFPDYLDLGDNALGFQFQVFFGALNIILALPVLMYSSNDYLKSAFAALSQRGVNLDVPISIGIITLFGRSVYEIVTGIGTGYMDSFTGLIFFLLIGKLIQQKTFDRLSFDRDYRSYLPIAVNVINPKGIEKSISLDKLKAGMKIRLRNQELVPCDSILISKKAYMDYSFITGESEPVQVNQWDLIYAGARLSGTSALLRTEEEVKNSYLTKLWNHEVFTNTNKELKLTSFADRISPYFTVSILGIAAIVGVYWFSVAGAETALSVFTAVLIIACPCALALSTPFTLGSTLNILSLNGLFVKNYLLLENLSKATAYVFDKTGTLTNKQVSSIDFYGSALTKEQKQLILSACKQSVHPVSRKIVQYLEDDCSGVRDLDSFFEVSGKGVFASFSGHMICIGSRNFIVEQMTLSHDEIPDTNFSGTISHLAINGTYLGFFGIKAGFRDGMPELLKTLKSSFKTFLISGDNESQRDEFSRHFIDVEKSLHFNKSPEEKLEFIKSLQKRTEKVIMVGDGLNDAGALKQSDFGIALSDDISSFSPACDAILEGNALKKLNIFAKFSSASMKTIIASFVLSLMYNTVGLGFAITGHLSPLVAAILMPLSSISVMVFTFLATRYSAKKLGLEIWK